MLLLVLMMACVVVWIRFLTSCFQFVVWHSKNSRSVIAWFSWHGLIDFQLFFHLPLCCCSELLVGSSRYYPRDYYYSRDYPNIIVIPKKVAVTVDGGLLRVLWRIPRSQNEVAFFINLCSVTSPDQGCYSFSISLELTTIVFKQCKLSDKHRILRQV